MAGEAKCKPVRDAMNIVAPQKEPEVTLEPTEGGLRRQRPREDPRAETDTRLADAEAKLAEAKSRLAEQEAVRLGGERNFARVQERLQPFQDAVERAQQEVEQMRRESR
jgi:chromosome segregation ATPase